MPFANYGSGNWSIGNYKLPELGVTELFGSKTGLYQPNYQSTGSNTQGIVGGTSGGGGGSWSSGSTQILPSVLGSGSSSSGGSYDAGETDGGTGGMSEEEYQAELNAKINEYYGQAMGRLNSQEDALRGSEQDYYNIATTPYTSQVPLVQQAGQEGQNAISTQQNAAGVQEQNALAAARRLYDELTLRNRQAFGSGALGSVGQAASEVLGRSAQQQFGNIRNVAGETMQKLYTAANDLKAKTEAQLQSLELQKNQALSQAKLWFKERLDAINAQREAIGQAKAEAKLDALREYRDYTRTLESQATALRSQISSNAQSETKMLQQEYDKLQAGIGSTVVAGANQLNTQGQTSSNAVNKISYANALSGNTADGSITDLLYGGMNTQGNGGKTEEEKRQLQSNPFRV